MMTMKYSSETKYNLAGTLGELKKAINTVVNTQSEGYDELKEAMFSIMEEEIPLYKKPPQSDYTMKSVRELKLKFGERPITENPF